MRIQSQILPCMFTIVLLILFGCSTTQPRYNTKYLPDAAAGNPAERIPFYVTQNRTIDNYLTSLKIAHDIALFWIDADRIFLNLDGAKAFSITIADQTIDEINIEDEPELSKRLSHKVNITNTITQKGLLRQIAGSLFSLSGQHYTGEISVTDQHILKVDVKTSETRADTGFEAETCTSAQLSGVLTISALKAIAVQWPYPCDWLPKTVADVKVPQILRKIQMAPSGDYLFAENTLYSVDPNGSGETLIAYDPYMISTAVNPDWTQIAILKGKKGKYWIELLNLGLTQK